MKYFRALGAFLCLATLGSAAFDPVAFNAAVELYTQRKPLEAQQAFEALATANPANANIQFYLGRLALQRDDHEKAITYLEKAVELSPNDSRFHHRLGDAYGRAAQKASFAFRLGPGKKCQVHYEQAVALDSKNLDARQSLMQFYLQAPGFAGGSNEKALGQAQAIKQLDVARGRIAVAGVYAADKKFDLAFAEFEEALTAAPDDYAALYQFGRLAALSGERLDRGLTVLRQCLTQTTPESQPSHATVHWRIGNILEKKGDQAGARASYETALKVDPKFPQAIESLKKL